MNAKFVSLFLYCSLSVCFLCVSMGHVVRYKIKWVNEKLFCCDYWRSPCRHVFMMSCLVVGSSYVNDRRAAPPRSSGQLVARCGEWVELVSGGTDRHAGCTGRGQRPAPRTSLLTDCDNCQVTDHQWTLAERPVSHCVNYSTSFHADVIRWYMTIAFE